VEKRQCAPTSSLNEIVERVRTFHESLSRRDDTAPSLPSSRRLKPPEAILWILTNMEIDESRTGYRYTPKVTQTSMMFKDVDLAVLYSTPDSLVKDDNVEMDIKNEAVKRVDTNQFVAITDAQTIKSDGTGTAKEAFLFDDVGIVTRNATGGATHSTIRDYAEGKARTTSEHQYARYNARPGAWKRSSVGVDWTSSFGGGVELWESTNKPRVEEVGQRLRIATQGKQSLRLPTAKLTRDMGKIATESVDQVKDMVSAESDAPLPFSSVSDNKVLQEARAFADDAYRFLLGMITCDFSLETDKVSKIKLPSNTSDLLKWGGRVRKNNEFDYSSGIQTLSDTEQLANYNTIMKWRLELLRHLEDVFYKTGDLVNENKEVNTTLPTAYKPMASVYGAALASLASGKYTPSTTNASTSRMGRLEGLWQMIKGYINNAYLNSLPTLTAFTPTGGDALDEDEKKNFYENEIEFAKVLLQFEQGLVSSEKAFKLSFITLYVRGLVDRLDCVTNEAADAVVNEVTGSATTDGVVKKDTTFVVWAQSDDAFMQDMRKRAALEGALDVLVLLCVVNNASNGAATSVKLGKLNGNYSSLAFKRFYDTSDAAMRRVAALGVAYPLAPLGASLFYMTQQVHTASAAVANASKAFPQMKHSRACQGVVDRITDATAVLTEAFFDVTYELLLASAPIALRCEASKPAAASKFASQFASSIGVAGDTDGVPLFITAQNAAVNGSWGVDYNGIDVRAPRINCTTARHECAPAATSSMLTNQHRDIANIFGDCALMSVRMSQAAVVRARDAGFMRALQELYSIDQRGEVSICNPTEIKPEMFGSTQVYLAKKSGVCEPDALAQAYSVAVNPA